MHVENWHANTVQYQLLGRLVTQNENGNHLDLVENLKENTLIECFLKKKHVYFQQSAEIIEPLMPLIQVASLLQARKESDQDVQVILDICSTLSTAQVVKVGSNLQ